MRTGKPRLSSPRRFWNRISSIFAFTLVLNEHYPQRKKRVTTIFHLITGDTIEMSDTEKVICKITLAGRLLPKVIVDFPNLIIVKPKKKKKA